MVEIVIINRGIEDEGQLRGMSIRGIYPDEIVRVSAPRDDAAVVSDHEDGRSHGHSPPPPCPPPPPPRGIIIVASHPK